MSDIVPFSSVILVGLVWIATTVRSTQLIHLFEKKYPELATREIPLAFTSGAHHEKLFFFFRKKWIPLLQQDRDIWKMRQQLLALLWASTIVPMLFIAVLVVLMVRDSS